ncbi:MAG: type III-B CRISPR module-associated protein Cmr5 [Planctomycetota bacterium]
MSSTTFEQRRAQHALASARRIEQEPDFAGRYRSYVDALPATILMNGLGQALAMLLSRANRKDVERRKPEAQAYHHLYQHLQDWLCHKECVYPGQASLIEAVTREDQRRYLRAQAEALAWLEWHKKFCRAFLAEKTPQGAEG